MLGLFLGLAQIAVLVLIGASIARFLFSPRIAAPFLTEPVYSQLFKGELVIPSIRASTEDLMILKYVNPKTGTIRESKPVPVPNNRGMVNNGETLWSVSSDDRIYETDGTKEDVFSTKHTLTIQPGQNKGAFLYEGRLAILDRGMDNIHRLMMLIDHDWVERAQLALPGAKRWWIHDERSGKSVLDSRFCQTFSDAPLKWSPIQVVRNGDQYHLFQTETIPGEPKDHPRHRILHRVGFDFTTGSDDAPLSAMAPANTPADTAGWELLNFSLGSYWFTDMVFHRGDFFFIDALNPQLTDKVVRRVHSLDEKDPEILLELGTSFRSDARLITDVDSKELFLVEQPQVGESILYRWNGERFEKLPIVVPGIATILLRQLGVFFLQILAVAWIGSWLCVFCANWLTNNYRDSEFSFGTTVVSLASIVRRALARSVDLALIFVPIVFTTLTPLVSENSEFTFRKLLGQRPIYDSIQEFQPVVCSAIWAAAVWTVIVLFTSFYGTSPGKWCFGIRVIRSTLRPCGFARALVRELLLWFDIPLMLTAIPAIIWFVGTRHRQRLGDVVADTIVIKRSGHGNSW